MGTRNSLRVVSWAALLACLASVHAVAAADGDALRSMYDGAMTPDVAVTTLAHTERLLPVRIVHRGGPVRALPRRTQAFPAIHFMDHGGSYDLYDYLASNRVAGLLVLKDGAIALEDYELGTNAKTRWASFSMAKSMASTMVGAAIADGDIASLDDPVERYAPILRDGAYAGVSIRSVLTMSSGVCWNETYTDPQSDRRKLLELQIAQHPDAVLRYMNALRRCGPPGTIWNYNTGETFVLGAVIEGATHRSLADYLSQKVWSQAGMDQDATWWVETPNGHGLAGSGVAATLRDYGRFALVVANAGQLNGRAIVPTGWFEQATAASMIGGKQVDYGYMWWIPPQADPIHAGAFEAIGIFGQFMYINPREHLAIVVLSARSKPSETALQLDDDAFFAAVASALH